MSLKESMLENKDHILDSLPTQELKDEFLNQIETVNTLQVSPSIEDQIQEAQHPGHISEDMYEGVKKEIEAAAGNSVKMSEEEKKAAVAEALKNPPAAEEGGDEL